MSDVSVVKVVRGSRRFLYGSDRVSATQATITRAE
jgi:hypothetical protein